jgi:O-antigen/teichoic acid export membrane protein
MRFGGWFTSALLAVALFYSVLLLGNYNLVASRVLGGQYQDLFMLTALWCLWAMLTSLHNGISLICQVLKKFKEISYANTLAAILSLGATYVFTIKYDLPGALAGVVISEALMIVMLFRMLIVPANSK